MPTMTSQSGKVQTVLGTISPQALGITLPHEHVLIDMTMGQTSATALINSGESAKKAGEIPEAGMGTGTGRPGGGGLVDR